MLGHALINMNWHTTVWSNSGVTRSYSLMSCLLSTILTNVIGQLAIESTNTSKIIRPVNRPVQFMIFSIEQLLYMEGTEVLRGLTRPMSTPAAEAYLLQSLVRKKQIWLLMLRSWYDKFLRKK
jgi:hypothetical protein